MIKDNNIPINMVVGNLEEEIKKGGALYFYRATPFTSHGVYNYDGLLKEDFFFKNLFTETSSCSEYYNEIKDQLDNCNVNTIILVGNQGCGKTTFVHYFQKKICEEKNFIILDFDKDTSNPDLHDYIERFSGFLFDKITRDFKENGNRVNKFFNNLYIINSVKILSVINANNRVENFFKTFQDVIINHNAENSNLNNFSKIIEQLFFNQLLSLVILWCIADFYTNDNIKPVVFCVDNLDVLVNQNIINGFFSEYYIFLRNIEAIIHNLKCKENENCKFSYNRSFSFIFSCRQHTWAKVKKSHLHQVNYISLSSYEKNITEIFDKNEILSKREAYIIENKEIYSNFSNEVSNIKCLLSDMKEKDNIYDLFNGDYRQCIITFEKLLSKNPNLLLEYINLKHKMGSKPLYGARGLIYKSLFDLFKENNLFNLIGVLDLESDKSFVSNARIILNYLDHYTYDNMKSVTFCQISNYFNGIIDRELLNNCLAQMFSLGIDDTLWNELIAFEEIDSDVIENCENRKIFITKAGHEYLEFIATHFEFFNVRINKERIVDYALYDSRSLKKYAGATYEYNFEEIIDSVMKAVYRCCEKMSNFYNSVMNKKYIGKLEYLDSPIVFTVNNKKNNRKFYKNSIKVFHGERIIHTHIRYIDNYRLFILKKKKQIEKYIEINKILINYIKKYIEIGKKFKEVTSSISDSLFLEFDKKVEIIESSNYQNFKLAIDVNKSNKHEQIYFEKL